MFQNARSHQRRLPIAPNLKQTAPRLSIDEDSGEWLAFQRMDAPRMRAAALAVSISAAFARQFNDEIVPYQSSDASSQVSPSGQRARNSINFIRWHQNDEVPSVAAPTIALDGEDLPVPLAPAAQVSGVFWATNEGTIPAAVPDEDYQFQTWYLPPSLYAKQPLDDTELPVQAQATVVDEEVCQLFAAMPSPPILLAVAQAEEIVTQPTTIVEEEYWQCFPPIMPRTANYYYAVADDEVFPAVVAEDYTIALQAYQQAVVAGVLPLDDELPQQTSATIVEEQDGQYQQMPPPRLIATFFSSEEEIPAQVTPLPIDEVYWLTFQLGPDVGKINTLWQTQFEDDVPVLSGPIIPPDQPGGEFIVRARRRGIR